LPFTETDDGKVELVAELRPGYDEERARKQELCSLVHGFALLAGALLVTAGVAWVSGSQGSLGDEFVSRKVLAYVLFFAEMASVGLMQRAVLNFRTAGVLVFLFVFAILNGISFSVFLLFVPAAALAYGFLVAAMTFATMSIYGAVSGRDLSATPQVMSLFVVGLAWMVAFHFLFSLGNWFQSTAAVGLGAFIALYAFHTEDIHEMWLDAGGASSGWRAAGLNAVLIYLEFLNLYGVVVQYVGRAGTRKVFEDD